MKELIHILTENLHNQSLLEVTGVVFGLASVLFAWKANILVFPTGIISVLIYVYICFISRLYADMAINMYYFVMSIYGWYYWKHKNSSLANIPVSVCSKKEIRNYLIIFAGSFILLAFILTNFTDSDVPYADSLTTAIFIAGMLLMARKKIENWIAWIIGDLISIPLYLYKGLVLTSLQFLILTIIAIAGYFSWKKMMPETAK